MFWIQVIQKEIIISLCWYSVESAPSERGKVSQRHWVKVNKIHKEASLQHSAKHPLNLHSDWWKLLCSTWWKQ